MRTHKTTTRLFFMLFLSVSLFISPAAAQQRKSDREHDGLNGSVKTVSLQVAKLSNKSGKLVEDRPTLIFTLDYDPQGNRVKQVFHSNYDDIVYPDGLANTRISYNYDSEGSRTESHFNPNVLGDIKTERVRWVFRYDDKGNRVEETLYGRSRYSLSNVMTLLGTYNHTYDDKGNKVASTMTVRGTPYYKWEYTCDNKGNVLEITFYKRNKFDKTLAYRYEFDPTGNWIKRVTSLKVSEKAKTFGEPLEVAYRTITYHEPVKQEEGLSQAGKVPTTVWVVPAGMIRGVPYEVIGEANPSRTPPPGVIVKSGVLTRGQAITRVNPAYPQVAREARVTGAVNVEMVIDEKGEVIFARAASGHPLLKTPAEEAARQWKFEPTTFDGVPVKVHAVITLNFGGQ